MDLEALSLGGAEGRKSGGEGGTSHWHRGVCSSVRPITLISPAFVQSKMLQVRSTNITR